MRRLSVLVSLLFFSSGSFALSIPYQVKIGDKKAEVFVVEEEGNFYLSQDDLKSFTSIKSSSRVRLENVVVNRGDLTIKADLPIEFIEEKKINVLNKGHQKAKKSESSSGFWVNYDLAFKNNYQGGLNASILTDINFANSKGHVFKTVQQVSDVGSYRLLTSYEINDEKSLNTWTFGDSYSSSYALATGTKFAGIQLRKNYALNPDYIYYPTLNLTTAASAQSVYELYENNKLISTGKVNRGAFSLSDYASFTGDGGNVKLIMRDSQGFEQVVQASLYTSPLSLRSGEYSYAFDLGKAYKQIDSFDDSVYTAGVIRRGFDYATFEAGADYKKDVNSYYLGAVVPTFAGVFTLRSTKGQVSDMSREIMRYGYEKRFNISDYSSLRLYASKETGFRESELIGLSYNLSKLNVFFNKSKFEQTEITTAGAGYVFDRFSLSAYVSEVNNEPFLGLSVNVPLGSGSTYYANSTQSSKQLGVYGGQDDFRYAANAYIQDDKTTLNGAVRKKYDSFEADLNINTTEQSELLYRGRVSGALVTENFKDYAFTRPVRNGSVLVVEFDNDSLPVKAAGIKHKKTLNKNQTLVTDVPAFYKFNVGVDFDEIEAGYDSNLSNAYVAKKGFNKIFATSQKPGRFVKLSCNDKELERGTVLTVNGEGAIYSSQGLYVSSSVKNSVRIEDFLFNVEPDQEAINFCYSLK